MLKESVLLPVRNGRVILFIVGTAMVWLYLYIIILHIVFFMMHKLFFNP